MGGDELPERGLRLVVARLLQERAGELVARLGRARWQVDQRRRGSRLLRCRGGIGRGVGPGLPGGRHPQLGRLFAADGEGAEDAGGGGERRRTGGGSPPRPDRAAGRPGPGRCRLGGGRPLGAATPRGFQLAQAEIDVGDQLLQPRLHGVEAMQHLFDAAGLLGQCGFQGADSYLHLGRDRAALERRAPAWRRHRHRRRRPGPGRRAAQIELTFQAVETLRHAFRTAILGLGGEAEYQAGPGQTEHADAEAGRAHGEPPGAALSAASTPDALFDHPPRRVPHFADHPQRPGRSPATAGLSADRSMLRDQPGENMAPPGALAASIGGAARPEIRRRPRGGDPSSGA